MGLGKTVIAIAAAEELSEQGKISTVLIVCPASLKYQWAERIAQFTNLPTQEKKLRTETIIIPSEGCVVIDGSKDVRRRLYLDLETEPERYVIVSYESVINDYSLVRRLHPTMVVLDEATAIKTFKAQRTKKIKSLKVDYRLALTGTPIENRPDELFSIMQWVDDSVLGRFDLFDKAYVKRNGYGWVTGYKNLGVLNKRLSPAFSRKTRKDPDVAPFLPDVDEDIWQIDMSPEILGVYKIIAADMLEEMEKNAFVTALDVQDYYQGIDESTPSGRLMGMRLNLEMLLDHPDLIIESGMNYEDTEGRIGSGYAYYLWQQGYLDNILTSPKLPFLRDKLTDIYSYKGNKVLIYSWSRNMVHMLSEEFADLDHVIFHGNMNPAQKAESVARYRNDPLCRLFISSHAGAYGMDMSMANYLINYDVPWSSGRADQINGRHVRASSEFSKVYIRNMVVQNSVEERKMRVLGDKRTIGSIVLDNNDSGNKGRLSLDTGSLKKHLTDVLQTGRIDK